MYTHPCRGETQSLVRAWAVLCGLPVLQTNAMPLFSCVYACLRIHCLQVHRMHMKVKGQPLVLTPGQRLSPFVCDRVSHWSGTLPYRLAVL